jgi:hypothetical protein
MAGKKTSMGLIASMWFVVHCFEGYIFSFAPAKCYNLMRSRLVGFCELEFALIILMALLLRGTIEICSCARERDGIIDNHRLMSGVR